jgi:hypothetical protein
MENRYLPILHRNISLRDLCASSESSLEGERVVKMASQIETTYYSWE